MQILDGILLYWFAKFCSNFITSTSFFNSGASRAAEQSQFADFLQTETWAWPPAGKHGLRGLTHLPRLLPPTVRFIPCHILICVTDPFSFTNIVSHIYFLILIQSTVTQTLSLIFLCHSIIFSITLILSHILSLLECLSDTQTHTPSVLVSAS